MYIIIKLLSYYYYFIISFFPHERRGLHGPILVLINSISSSSYINCTILLLIFIKNTYNQILMIIYILEILKITITIVYSISINVPVIRINYCTKYVNNYVSN